MAAAESRKQKKESATELRETVENINLIVDVYVFKCPATHRVPPRMLSRDTHTRKWIYTEKEII